MRSDNDSGGIQSYGHHRLEVIITIHLVVTVIWLLPTQTPQPPLHR